MDANCDDMLAARADGWVQCGAMDGRSALNERQSMLAGSGAVLQRRGRRARSMQLAERCCRRHCAAMMALSDFRPGKRSRSTRNVAQKEGMGTVAAVQAEGAGCEDSPVERAGAWQRSVAMFNEVCQAAWKGVKHSSALD